MTLIKLFKTKLNFNVAVIKNIHEHEVDSPEKDSYKYSDAGAIFSITKNIYNEHAIFLKKKIKIEELIDWLSKSPYRIDVILIEGFKGLHYPSILCASDMKEVETKIDNNVKIISGIISNRDNPINHYLDIPILDVEKEFSTFLDILGIR